MPCVLPHMFVASLSTANETGGAEIEPYYRLANLAWAFATVGQGAEGRTFVCYSVKGVPRLPICSKGFIPEAQGYSLLCPR